MSAKAANQPAPRARSHIIERPRLTKLLDGSKARIILLVAPAGYGKTTLARQFLRTKRSAWYRADHASTDIAALSVGLARATGMIVSGLDRRVEARLKGTATPEAEAEPLGEMLAAELEEWPTEAWLAIDDYHVLIGSHAPERLVDLLITLAPLNVLITSRVRPSWATTRRLLYQEVLLVGPDDLSFRDAEASAVLGRNRSHPVPPELIARARGWPAVIGLAAVADQLHLPERGISKTLHDYFAEEIYQALSLDGQRDLPRLSALPSLTPEKINLAIGRQDCSLQEALNLGLLTYHPGEGYDLHPLLRAFLETKLRDQPDAEPLLEKIVQSLIARGEFDDAYFMIEKFELFPLLPKLFEGSLRHMIAQSRLSTLESWISSARRSGVHFPLLNLADAEIARRHGSFDRGEVLALQAAAAMNGDDTFLSQALAVAGESAHLAMRSSSALDHHRRAEAASKVPDDRMRSVWGQFVESVELENGLAESLLERLAVCADGSPSATLRVMAGRLVLAGHNGAIEAASTAAAPLIHLVPDSHDPLIVSMFLYRLAFSRVLAGRYGEALGILEAARREVERFGLGFVTRHLASVEAAACLGLRQFRRASYLIETADDIAHSSGDAYIVCNSRLLRARHYLARGEASNAMRETELDWRNVPGRGLLGEARAVRALALLALGDTVAAGELAEQAAATTTAVEARTLCALILACIEGADEHAEADGPHLRRAIETVGQTENYDSLVWAYRTEPSLLARLAAEPGLQQLLSTVVGRASDLHLGRRAGLESGPGGRDRFAALSPREREVFELLCQGLRNKEIARKLFISEVTTKAHLRSIFGKLGVRTRTEAVMKAQEP